MANTDPVVDDPAILSALRERAAAEASVPTGFVGHRDPRHEGAAS